MHTSFAELNVLDRYAETKRISVIVVDENGKAVKDGFIGWSGWGI